MEYEKSVVGDRSRNDVDTAMTSEEKLWLLALTRGPITSRSVQRSMSELLRDSLIAKGLVRQRMGAVQITRKGSSLANELIRST